MLYVAAVVALSLAGFVGLLMAVFHFHGRTPPWAWVAVIHGLFAAVGIGLVTAAVVLSGDEGQGLNALLALVVTALAGLGLISFHGRSRRLPNALVVTHAALALGTFGFLLWVAAHNL